MAGAWLRGRGKGGGEAPWEVLAVRKEEEGRQLGEGKATAAWRDGDEDKITWWRG